MTEPPPKRRPGRPKSTTPPPEDHNVRMPIDRWNRLGEVAQRLGTHRAGILNDFAAWLTHEPGAKAIRRPPAPPIESED